MFKLYKRDDTGRIIAYHEAWAEPDRRRIVEHWGILGEPGQSETYRIKLLGSLERQFDGILDPVREEGFEELEDSDFKCLIVEYKIDGFGTEDDLTKRHALEDRLNEILGWTGLGHCDGGSSGSDSMEAACFVVDVDLATSVIKDALNEGEFSNYSRIYQE